MLACELADAVSWDRGAVGVGLVVDAGELVDQIEVVALDAIDEMAGPISFGDHLRVPRFVVGRIGESDRARVDRPGRALRHRGDHGARVDATGEKRAERYFGDEPEFDGLVE